MLACCVASLVGAGAARADAGSTLAALSSTTAPAGNAAGATGAVGAVAGTANQVVSAT